MKKTALIGGGSVLGTHFGVADEDDSLKPIWIKIECTGDYTVEATGATPEAAEEAAFQKLLGGDPGGGTKTEATQKAKGSSYDIRNDEDGHDAEVTVVPHNGGYKATLTIPGPRTIWLDLNQE